jgi:pyridoxal phosphate enzyme (YggS family)
MAVLVQNYKELIKELGEKVTLVAVSKTRPAEDIKDLYNIGHRDFGENYVQELVEKAEQLPKDIRWHFIGHLQTNKVKLIAPLIHLIHGVDSLKLLKEINKQGERNERIINCLLQVHIAEEETKFGLDSDELAGLINHLTIQPFNLRSVFDQLQTPDLQLPTLSMGMSADYKIAVEEGSNMVRIGSLIFGERD